MSHWTLRVASRPQVGGGHVLRSLVLARALAAHGPVDFVLDPGGTAWGERIAEAGFAWQVERGDDALLPAALIDSYEPGLAERWRARTRCLAVMHDGAAPPAFPDLVIAPWLEGACADPHVLAGIDYALVDPAYPACPPVAARPVAGHVLVSFGLRDSPGATGRVLAALTRLAVRDWLPEVTVVMGAQAPHRAAVEKAVCALGPRARLVVDAPGLAGLLGECDLAVGAGGVSAAERAAAGRPSLTVTIADNQRGVARLLADRGATVDMGSLAALADADLDEALWQLASDAARRTALAEAGRRAVDGEGARRVADALARLYERTA